MYLIKMTSVFLFLLFFSCCGENSDEVQTTGDPENLVVSIDVTEDGSGEINVTASADHVEYFEFHPGDGTDAKTFDNGTLNHTYEFTGTYQAEIRAYGSSGRYLSYTESFLIITGEEGSKEQGYTTPMTYDGYNLIWQDEFGGNSVDQSYWNFEMGDGCPNLCGWGNNELQYYRERNTSVAGGFLTITARQEPFANSGYTSSRLTTQGKFSFKYGRVDIRAKMPEGKGIWPALWMLGSNIDQVSWPACGEIDIMEMIGGGDGNDNVVHGTAHWDAGGHNYSGDSKKVTEGNLSDEFYVYSIIWNETSIRWFINDEQYYTLNLGPTDLSEFKNNFFLIMNVAVGGNWPGVPNATTQFPQSMTVDYIRVFQLD